MKRLTASSWSSPSTSNRGWSWQPWKSPSMSRGRPWASSSGSRSYSKPKTPGTFSDEGFHLHQLIRRKGGGRGGRGGGRMSRSSTRRCRPPLSLCMESADGVFRAHESEIKSGRKHERREWNSSTLIRLLFWWCEGTIHQRSNLAIWGHSFLLVCIVYVNANIRGFGAALFPLWMASHPHGYYVYHLNRTLPAENNAYAPGNSTTKYPVLCFCETYGVCGCDDIKVNRTTAVNETVRWNTAYALWNGTGYSLLNGTLANGTTAPGGTENSGSSLNGLGWILYASCFLAGLYLVH
jgi:hypothetical protein